MSSSTQATALAETHANGQMTDALLERVSRLTGLEALDLGSCRHVTDRGIGHLARLGAAVRHLNLAGTAITDSGVDVLRDLSAVESFDLSWTGITDAGVNQLSACRALRRVASPAVRKYFASYNRITDRTPEILSGMDALEEMILDTCVGVTNAGIAAFARLHILRVSGMPRVTRDVTARFRPGVDVRYAP